MFLFAEALCVGLSDEEQLFKNLFREYNPSARPVINSSRTVMVSIQFSLLHIKDLVRLRSLKFFFRDFVCKHQFNSFSLTYNTTDRPMRACPAWGWGCFLVITGYPSCIHLAYIFDFKSSYKSAVVKYSASMQPLILSFFPTVGQSRAPQLCSSFQHYTM